MRSLGDLSQLRRAIVVVLMLIGAVWFLQGIGILGGSVMSGRILWAFLGAAAFVAGLVVWFQPGRPRPPDEPVEAPPEAPLDGPPQAD